jgi:hypothetical protein
VLTFLYFYVVLLEDASDVSEERTTSILYCVESSAWRIEDASDVLGEPTASMLRVNVLPRRDNSED